MSNNKQSSSIDWLINEHFGGMENCTPDFRYKIEQAKAMHKEEIEASYSDGYKEGYNRAIELVEWKIKNELKIVNNEQQ